MVKKNVIKILILFVFIAVLTGCSNSWKRIFDISGLQIKNNHIVGKVKNKKDSAYDVEVEFELNNGRLSDEKKCNFIIRPYETRDLYCVILNHDDYDVVISNIEFKEKDIPVLKDGEIDEDILEYYFEDILETHVSNTIDFTLLTSYSTNDYPFIHSATYYKENDEIEIISIFNDNDNNYTYYYETFDTTTNKLKFFGMMVYTKDEEVAKTLKYAFSNNEAFKNLKSGTAYSVINRENSSIGRCYPIGTDWCISVTNDPEAGKYDYFVERQ